MFQHGVLCILLISVTPLFAGRRSVNPCEPCRHIRPYRRPSTTQHLCRFTRDLGAVQSVLINKLRPYVYNQRIPADYSFCTEEIHQPEEDCHLTEIMLDAYNTLTDENARLEVLNNISDRTLYMTAYLLTPLCDMWKALRNEGLEIPCALCDKSTVQLPSNVRPLSQTATLYVNATLHSSICRLGNVIQKFRTIVNCHRSF